MRKRVLLLDDDQSIARSVSRVLSRDFDVDIFLQGEIALEALRRHEYHCIVSDFDMAGMDGDEFYRRVVAAFPEMRDHFVFHTGTIYDTSPGVPRVNKRDTDAEELRTMVRSRVS